MPTSAVVLLIALGVALALMIWLIPTQVRYSEAIIIDASSKQLYDNVRFQARLMDWSAWPSETGSTCSCENTDGVIGARTVFFSKGERFGYQEITNLIDGQVVELALFSKGPPQKPLLTFSFASLGPDRTEVRMSFENTLHRPFNVILRLAGIVRWTRKMHGKDLQGLKRYSEPPFLTYAGKPVSAPAQTAS